jgi:L-cysteine S-thiosulfotransferase
MKIAPAIALASALTALPAFANEIPPDQRRSGYDFMAADTKAIQDDDTSNPGMLWVLDGEALWKAKSGNAAKSCADCHGEARETMKGVAARYPSTSSSASISSAPNVRERRRSPMRAASCWR